MKTLIIDNFDSFTFNLYQFISKLNGEPPTVVRNHADWDMLRKLDFDNIVISPGPGRPDREADFGICRNAILEAEVPVLGVCLGHQGIGHLCGGKVVLAPEPMHGRLSRIRHDDSALFAGIPQGSWVVRYHSLMVASPLPADVEPIAWTEDGILMGMRHRSRPLWGVQFHPESIGTEHGMELLRNFRELTRAYHAGRKRTPPAGSGAALSVVPTRSRPPATTGPEYELHVRKLDVYPEPERVYVGLFGNTRDSFWLDSSSTAAGARFHFMGDASGPCSLVVRCDLRGGELTITTPGGSETRRESIFDFLARVLAERSIAPDAGLPFDFSCGFAGYFGYELKAECGADDVHPASTPDAYFVFADRLLAFDSAERSLYLLCLTRHGHAGDAQRWFDEIAARLAALPPLLPLTDLDEGRPPPLQLAREHDDYVADIQECLREIRLGESYEVCLTNRLRLELDIDPLAYYRVLRHTNPAPYAAFLNLGDAHVACSSPERFLRIDRERWVESKPIKGTLPRGRTAHEDATLREALRNSEKDRSENLMIVDLVRNDLGLVCEVGTVHVPQYMQVESYATVHQLVSTIRGRLREDMTTVDCVRAAFPGGSMTGAPKIRTMQIIDRLETDARGVYSGAIGFLSVNGAADLNIVIRTAVFERGGITVGVGGAIVALSSPEAEFEEILLKGRALVRAAGIAAEAADRPAHQPASDARVEAKV